MLGALFGLVEGLLTHHTKLQFYFYVSHPNWMKSWDEMLDRRKARKAEFQRRLGVENGINNLDDLKIAMYRLWNDPEKRAEEEKRLFEATQERVKKEDGTVLLIGRGGQGAEAEAGRVRTEAAWREVNRGRG
jgi:hypothetical protein